MAVLVRNRKGKQVTLLNPSEKATKYAHEMAFGIKYTNNGEEKLNRKGQPKRLTDLQRSYRAGYLAHQKDSNRAFKSKHPNYKRKTR